MTLLVLLILTAFGAFLTYEMLKLGDIECQLCIEFKSQTHCSTALGPTEKEALDEAHRNACAILASGVTEVLACNRAPRSNIQCSP